MLVNGICTMPSARLLVSVFTAMHALQHSLLSTHYSAAIWHEIVASIKL